MAVGAHYLAAADLGLQLVEGHLASDQLAQAPLLGTHVVEVENLQVAFTTVEARVLRQVLGEALLQRCPAALGGRA
jgi:hypothetical protein